MTTVFQDIFILLRATRLGAEWLESATFYHVNGVLKTNAGQNGGRSVVLPERQVTCDAP
jgi:hypothetical protein